MYRTLCALVIGSWLVAIPGVALAGDAPLLHVEGGIFCAVDPSRCPKAPPTPTPPPPPRKEEGVATRRAAPGTVQYYLDEAKAWCAEHPYRCPSSGAPIAEPHTPEETDAVCGMLDNPTINRRHEIGTAAAIESDRIWKTSCQGWRERKQQQRDAERRARPVTGATSSTIDCVTTSYDGLYSSHLTTTCTQY